MARQSAEGVGMQLVVAMPVFAPARLPLESGWPDLWSRSYSGIVRQIGSLGNFRFAQIKPRAIATTTKDSSNRNFSVSHASYIALSKSKGLLVAVFEVPTESASDWLRRPGSKDARSYFEATFGVLPNPESTVYATSVKESKNSTSCNDAQLLTQNSEAKEVFALRYSILTAAIGAERFFLDRASTQAKSAKIDFLLLKSRASLSWLKDWQEVPNSDSTTFLNECRALRECLFLDERKSVAIRALENRIRSFDIGAGAALASFGVFQSSVNTIDFVPFLGFSGFAISLALALGTGITAWKMVRN